VIRREISLRCDSSLEVNCCKENLPVFLIVEPLLPRIEPGTYFAAGRQEHLSVSSTISDIFIFYAAKQYPGGNLIL
jgi:hypothetical protein